MEIRLSRNRRSFLLQVNGDQSEELTEQQQLRRAIRQRVYNFVKTGVFLVFWLFFTILISISSPIEPHEVLIPLRSQEEQTVSLLNLYNESTGISVTIEPNPIDTTQGIIFGFLLLSFLYTLIILDITDRTFAAILTATAAIGVLSLMNSRPHLHTIISWIDMETLMLLFGMMVMVGILSDTGVFDYLSVFAYQLSRGKIWFLIFYLCMFTGFLSAFLDNVTMVLLMVPVTIRLCEILRLKTILVLISIAIFSNIGGTLTPVGDPPNVIIATNPFVSANGIEFLNFTLHMFPGVMVSNLLAYLMLYLMGRNKLVATNEAGLLRSIRSLEKQLNDNKNNQNIRSRIDELKDRLKNEHGEKSTDFHETLADMKEKYRIKDKVLLIKCCICFGFAICMFFLHSFPFMSGINLCWAAMLGALLLIILADKPNFKSILKRVEWSTLIFFASLFIFMESLVEMGLIDWVGELTISVILSVEKNYQLAVAILLVLWVSALTSAFVDNIPITTMMLKVSLLNLYNESTGMSVTIEPNPIDTTQGIIFGFLLLSFLYTLMMLDITDRTFAAILTATAAIGVLSLMNSRPHLETIISWIDVETLMLLFGMMVMVGILSDTGVFDYVSVFAYQLSRGKIWFLIFYLCMFTGFLSAFFDNVSMVLLMVPVTIRLCEILRLNTIFVVISIAIFANIGGTLTPVGDPPNVITATNFFVSANGIHFLNFTLHMFPGVMVSNLLAFLMLYLMGRNNLVASNEAGLLRSIRSLEKQLNSNNQNIRKRIDELKDRLKYEIGENSKNFQETLADMKEKCRIKDKTLLIKCCICFGFAICMFFFHSFPFMPGMKICWAAMLGALLLIILADKPYFDFILKRVDWSTLIFFASLFIFVESLVKMGLIDWVGESTISVILSVEKNYQLAVAILLVLWVSALTSAFVDNIPITTMMLKVTINLATNSDLALPLPPLIWALSFVKLRHVYAMPGSRPGPCRGLSLGPGPGLGLSNKGRADQVLNVAQGCQKRVRQKQITFS
ncbi:hypothetical protein ACLKA7_004107 [Drosophila subpalustris]